MIKYRSSQLNNVSDRPKATTNYPTTLHHPPHNIKYMCLSSIIVLVASLTKKSSMKAISCTESNNKSRISDLDGKVKSKSKIHMSTTTNLLDPLP